MIVLGLSCFYHDSGAALVRDGELVAAAEEERFNRKKHYSDFPLQAAHYCLEEAGISIKEVDHIGFYEKPLVKFDRILETILAGWPGTCALWTRSMPTWLLKKLRIGSIIQDQLRTDQEVLYCQHHVAHAASAFLVSPFEEAAVITADGVGEWATTAWGAGRGVDIDLKQEIRFPHSIGLLYSAITAYLGFRVNDAEWKVMGLAAYGKPRHVDKFREIVDIKEDGSFRLNLKYFGHTHSTRRAFTRHWEQLFGRPQRMRESDLDTFHEDLACSGQKIVEEMMLNIARHVHESTAMDRVCLAGGVGLNSVANWRILRESGFKDMFIQPAAGDSGGALGTAFYIYHAMLRNPRRHVMNHALFGPAFSDDEILAVLRSNDANYSVIADQSDLVEYTARAIAAGKVVGWYQGRMEFGPRALGSRSLLADPRKVEMKEIINAKVKFREPFRPFAPAVLKERAHEFFDMPPGMEAPFMLLVPKVRPEKRDQVPAVVHADGTGRVQTVSEEANPLYYRVIKRFGELTGVPVIINTSFNVRGEPIVCTPQDAYDTFVKTGIDLLVMGRCVVADKQQDIDFSAGMERSVALESEALGAGA